MAPRARRPWGPLGSSQVGVLVRVPLGGSPSPPRSPSALMTSCTSSSVGDCGHVLPGAVGSAIVVSLCPRAEDGLRTSCGCPVPVAARFVARAVGVAGRWWGSLNVDSAGWCRTCSPGSPGRSLARGGVRRSPSTSLPFVGPAASPLFRGVGGGLPPLWGAPGVRRRPSSGRPPLGAGAAARTCCPCSLGGVGGTGDTVPAPLRALLRAGVACPAGGGGAPPGRAPCPVAGGLRGLAPVPPRLPVLRAPVEVHHPLAVGAGVRAWGPSTVPLACMPCGRLRAAGLVGGRPLGGGLPPLRGASGVRRCPSPSCPSLGAGSQDPLPMCTGHGWCGYGGPSTGLTARALASWRCALWGWR